MKKYIFSLILTLLSSCGQEEGKYDLWIHPSLRADVGAFFQDVKKHNLVGAIGGIEIITISELEDPYIGYCYMNKNAIFIDQRINEFATRATVYHELTHCIFGLVGHDPDPTSIFAESMPEDLTEENWEQKKAELFMYILNNSPYEKLMRKHI